MPDESAAAERQGAKLRPGTVLADRYCIESIVGAGGFGVVWQARHVHLETECAIKLFDPPPGTDAPDCGARFLQEARLMARLKCPYVAQVFDYGVHEGMPFLVLELLRGSSLARHLQLLRAREARMSPAETARMLRHVAEALQLAHAAQVVHRDLKPDNIFLVQEGETTVAKVLDFGIAKWSADTAPSMTTTRTVMGTAHYMSPEQFESARYVDHRSDLWSLGVIAFECLTGQLPFPGDSFIEVAFKVCKEGPLVASQLAPVPAGFDAWFFQATAVAREHRFDSALAQAEAFERVCAEPAAREPAAPSQAASEKVPAMAATLQLSAGDAPSPVAAKARARRWSAGLGAACLFGAFATWRVLFAGSPGSAAAPAREVTARVEAVRPSSSEATPGPAQAPAGAAVDIPAAPAAVPLPAAVAAEDAGAVRSSTPPSTSSAKAPKPVPAPPKARPAAASMPKSISKGDAPRSESERADGESSAPIAREDDPDSPFTEPAPSAVPGAAPALPGPDIENTTFDRAAAKAALDAAAEQARHCRPPGGLTGMGRVQVIFDPSGKVTSVTLLTSRFEDTETGSCVRMVFRRAKVPAFQGAPGIVINKSFEIPEPGDPMFRLEPLRRRP